MFHNHLEGARRVDSLIVQSIVKGDYITLQLKEDIERSLLALDNEELINILKDYNSVSYWHEIMPDPYTIFCACNNRQSVCEWIVDNILDVSYEEKMDDYCEYDHPDWHRELYKKWVEKRQVSK